MEFIERLKSEKFKRRLTGIVIFGALYLLAFFWIEQRNVHIHLIRMEIDRKIPFCEYFIIPYVLWFFFVAFTVLYFGLYSEDDREYGKLATTLVIGMVVFVLVSYIYPNGHNLRPKLNGDSIFIQMVQILYKVDTSTNILPSLHVFNSIACGIALLKNRKVKQHKVVRAAIVVLVISIVLSTVFLKQHSMLDVLVALMMNLVCYGVIYMKEDARHMRHEQRVWLRKEL